jgi:hypothetical protein
VKKVFVVQGSTGEYSSRDDWNVCAYEDEELAKRHVLLADEWSTIHFRRYEDPPPNPYDPFMKQQYTGTFYTYDAVEVRDALPEVPGDRVPDEPA